MTDDHQLVIALCISDMLKVRLSAGRSYDWRYSVGRANMRVKWYQSGQRCGFRGHLAEYHAAMSGFSCWWWCPARLE